MPHPNLENVRRAARGEAPRQRQEPPPRRVAIASPRQTWSTWLGWKPILVSITIGGCILSAILYYVATSTAVPPPPPPTPPSRTGRLAAQATVAVDPQHMWTDSGIKLKKGDIVTIIASGQVNTTTQPGDVYNKWVGPDGWDYTPQVNINGAPARWVQLLGPNTPIACLTGRIGHSPPFKIGKALGFTAETGGNLYLGVNGAMSDYQGKMMLTLDQTTVVWPGSAGGFTANVSLWKAAGSATSPTPIQVTPPARKTVILTDGTPHFDLTSSGWQFSKGYQIDLVPSQWFDTGLTLKPGQDLAWNYLQNEQAPVGCTVGAQSTTAQGPINFGTNSWYEAGGVSMNEAAPNEHFIQVPDSGAPIRFRALQTPISIRAEIWYRAKSSLGSQETEAFSDWMSSDQYQREVERQLQLQHYPSKVQGRNIAGTNQFRAIFLSYPIGQFAWDSRHSLDAATFNQWNEHMLSQGYQLEGFDTFVDSSGSSRYQATWVRK
jgi:hypothetical protein